MGFGVDMMFINGFNNITGFVLNMKFGAFHN